MSRVLALWLALGTCAWAAGPNWQYRVVDTVKPGQPVELILQPQNTVHGVVVTLTSEHGRTHTFEAKRIEAGKAHTFKWKVPLGVTKWSGTLTGSADGATTTAPIELKSTAARPLDVRFSKRDIDLSVARVVVRPTNPLSKVEVRAYDTGGGEVLDTTADLEDVGAGATAVTFDVPAGTELRRVELKLHDAYGYWAALRIVSWYAEIEHEEVEFETAKWDIRPSEAPKVDKAIRALTGEVARFRRELGNDAATLDVQVFVAGYTDTVGKASDNQVLSHERAKAIAGYFRDHGLTVPVFYQGFGEAVLAVETPDDTDEARNRRAVYVLSNVPPSGGAYPRAQWKRLSPGGAR